MRAEWLRCSLVLEGVEVENPLRCRLSMDMFRRLDIGNWYVVLLIPRLESFKCERYVCLFFASVPWLSWLSNAAQYFGYHQTSHVSPFTRVMFKDNGIPRSPKKFWVPGMVCMFFF